MTTGDRTAEQVVRTVVKYEYPPANGLEGCTIVIDDGIMTMNAQVQVGESLQEWQTILPLAAAPLMVVIANDMMTELASQQKAQAAAIKTSQ